MLCVRGSLNLIFATLLQTTIATRSYLYLVLPKPIFSLFLFLYIPQISILQIIPPLSFIQAFFYKESFWLKHQVPLTLYFYQVLSIYILSISKPPFFRYPIYSFQVFLVLILRCPIYVIYIIHTGYLQQCIIRQVLQVNSQLIFTFKFKPILY